MNAVLQHLAFTVEVAEPATPLLVRVDVTVFHALETAIHPAVRLRRLEGGLVLIVRQCVRPLLQSFAAELVLVVVISEAEVRLTAQTHHADSRPFRLEQAGSTLVGHFPVTTALRRVPGHVIDFVVYEPGSVVVAARAGKPVMVVLVELPLHVGLDHVVQVCRGAGHVVGVCVHVELLPHFRADVALHHIVSQLQHA